MLRYNAKYQKIADDFAIAHGEGKWIGAHYIGHLHESILSGTDNAHTWLAFEPLKNVQMLEKTGMYYYILINNEELILYTNIFGKGNKLLQLDSLTVRYRQKFLKK